MKVYGLGGMVLEGVTKVADSCLWQSQITTKKAKLTIEENGRLM